MTIKKSKNKSLFSVEIRNVSKTFNNVTALKNIVLNIYKGEFFSLLGPSGCGKTTTLRLIAGLEMVTDGNIFIGGKEVTHISASDRDVSMVFQSYALFPHMTVMQNVTYGLAMSQMPKLEAKEKAMEGLELVGLAGFGERLPSELSGGQQQRVAVARALVLEPEVLLFDEPLSNLDAKLRRRVRQEIRELQQKLELTTVYVTHDQREALTMSDRIAVINHGRLQQVDTPEVIYNQPANSFVADFIGESTMLPLKTEENNQLYFNHILVDSVPDQESSQDWMLVVRPERLFPLSQDSIDTNQHLIFKGKVIESVYQGETAFAQVSICE